jgi:diguanylate cyclase (GGDEF)-like protein
MQSKSKLLFIVSIMLLVLTTATIINIFLNFRDYSINSAVEKSKMTADIVKDALTAHMINGTMEKRGYFINQISTNNKTVKSLWIVRAENVVKQYGEGLHYEAPRDEIDKKVLQTGETLKQVFENTNDLTLRVSIPYKATANAGGTNCLTCHNVQIGDTLGAISMEFDISDMRTSATLTILKIFAINIVFLVIVLFLLNHYATPYMKLFSNIEEGVKKASKGDFTHKFETTIKGDPKNVIYQLNTLFLKMQETFGDIRYTLATFIPQGRVSSNDPLYEAKIIINELADIYKFKKTIELDASKVEVYKRITDILKLKYNLKHFALYEVNNISHQRKLYYQSDEDAMICEKRVNHDTTNCRAYRTKSVTISSEFPNLCSSCIPNIQNYICIPFTINNDISLVISISGQNENEIDDVKEHISNIKHYFEAAKPVVESQILMEKLRDTSLRDGMTGLYNRRFLEEVIDKIMHQATRSKDTYSVLMIDVDFFKMVNDTYGHDVGDKVIVEIGRVLKDNIRESDLAIRYGGEEFIVMLKNASDEGTQEVAKKIHDAFAELSFDAGNGETFQKTMSIGISKFPQDANTIWKCIKFSDTALYVAKTTGRNKIVYYEKAMSENEDLR